MTSHRIFKLLAPVFTFLLLSHACDKNSKQTVENSLNSDTHIDLKVEEVIKYKFNGDYKETWRQIDSLEQKGLYQSALTMVTALFEDARKNHNAVEVVKSTIYKMKYHSYISEDDYVISINELESLAKSEQAPLKQLIHSITAETYWNYYSNNRWKFINRSTTVDFKNTDITTWSLSQIVQKTNENYLLSLTSRSELKQIPISEFEYILLETSDSKLLTPTLFDFLALRAVEHFKSSETSLTRPAEKYSISGKEYFGDNATFSAILTKSDDTLSNDLFAIRILQELESIHVNDKSPETLIQWQLNRLQFVKLKCKDELVNDWYIKALDALALKHASNESSAEINYYQAIYYQELGLQYNTSIPEYRLYLNKAIEICNSANQKFPKSFGANNCISLKSQIEEKSMDIQLAEAYSNTENVKIKLNFKNVSKLYFRIVPADYLEEVNYRYENNHDRIKNLLEKKTIEQWEVSLPQYTDYQEHSIELKIPKLSPGNYVILASATSDFRLTKNAIVTANFWITDLSYTYKYLENGDINVFVANRETGEPMSDVKIKTYQHVYNYTSRKNDLKQLDSYATDSKGMATIVSKTNYRSLLLRLKKGENDYFSRDEIYSYNYNRGTQKASYTTNFFTDRAIYRPGQTIYFKGITIKHLGDEHSIQPNTASRVTFYDVNYQKIAELDLISNEYGTFSGSFTAPSSGLNGRMTIQSTYGRQTILVEEYKRPKFEVSFEPIKKTYKLDQEITANGKATAYSGSVIDGAKVQFRVKRSASFPSWCYYRWGYVPQTRGEQEILSGETTTNDKGEFSISFLAKKDGTVDSKFYPNYTYTVSADITDINGETRSTTQRIVVGTTSMNLSTDIPSEFDNNQKHNYTISTTNLNGQKVGATGDILVTKMIAPTSKFRPTLWESPDTKNFTEKEYSELFPNDAYDNENDYTNWKKGDVIIHKSFNTAKETTLSLKEFASCSGVYLVENTAIDTFGVQVQEISYITIFDSKSKTCATTDLFKAIALTPVRETGQTASFLLSASLASTTVLYEIEHKGKIIASEFIKLNAEQRLISLPITEQFRGNVTVHFTTTKKGRVFTNSFNVQVPFSNKELTVKFETFRDKLLPGAEESWQLRITGPKSEKVAAELLVSMYDASLDAFAPNSFGLSPYQYDYSTGSRQAANFNTVSSNEYSNDWNEYMSSPYRSIPTLNWWGMDSYGRYYNDSYSYRGSRGSYDRDEMSSEVTEVSISANRAPKGSADKSLESLGDGIAPPSPPADITSSSNFSNGLSAIQQAEGQLAPTNEPVQMRTNLNETAFFFPQLHTDADGSIILKFKMPEALTKWKMIGLAHTKDLKIGTFLKEVVTQKELMVQPNAPRFFREGDKMTFSAKVSNISEDDMIGEAQLLLFDALTSQPIDALFENSLTPKSFEVKKGLSVPLTWEISIPEGIGAVKYQVVARTKNHSDGEEMVVPILSNRILVTESLALPSKGIGSKDFYFQKLIDSKGSSTIKHHQVTLEYTSNPAWYAIQAMPYMMEYPYECAEQTFTRYYANAIASNIVNSSPKIKQVFESWKTSSPDAFLSNLQKNQELKSVMLEETPWVLEAKDENERKKRVGLLFDLNKMDNELNSAIDKLVKMQVSNGGWAWFPGMEESRYITQHIVTGMGHLDHLGIKNVREEKRVWKMVQKSVQYLDNRLVDDLNWLKKYSPNYLKEQHISEFQVQYLYARSYFKDIPMDEKTTEAFNYYSKQAEKYWLNFNIYNEGMIALFAKRYDKPALASGILKSLKERAIVNDELGMYWKDNVSGYYWYQAPIETQAMLIEAFDEIGDNSDVVEELKVWLLKQKQTTDWKTTKATAEACYALLLRGTSILENTEDVAIKINGLNVKSLKPDLKQEAGTGYFKTSWSGAEITPDLGKINVTRTTKGVSWGAMYWQYFEDLNKITTAETNLKLAKKLFIVKNSSTGPVISPITSSTTLKVGDKVRVRIELRTDRNMEYVHMKDMRAAGFEPMNVISRYKYQDGLGYYESTRDAATHFFFDYLPKGTYVFEYDIRVSHAGSFSNGVATIQCMYAPEFTSHSEGLQVEVK